MMKDMFLILLIVWIALCVMGCAPHEDVSPSQPALVNYTPDEQHELAQEIRAGKCEDICVRVIRDYLGLRSQVRAK